MQNSRELSFDALKLLAIFLVLWGHSIQYFSSTNYVENIVYRIIYSFHMPLFMTISGYFSINSMKSTIGSFIQKKLTQLILPCVTWSLVLLILNCIHNGYGYSLYQFIIKYIETFHLNFWFLKSLFLCYLIVYIGKRMIKNELVFYTLSIIFIELTMDFYHMHTMYPSFILGIILRKHQNQWFQKAEIAIGTSILFLFLLIFWDAHLFTSTKMLFNNYFFDFLFNSLYKLFIGLIGAFAIISQFNYLFRKVTNKHISNLCKMGQYTLGIYILQTIIIEKELSLFLSFNQVSNTLYTFVITPSISLITITICICIIKLISQNKKLSIICFGKG